MRVAVDLTLSNPSYARSKLSSWKVSDKDSDFKESRISMAFTASIPK